MHPFRSFLGSSLCFLLIITLTSSCIKVSQQEAPLYNYKSVKLTPVFTGDFSIRALAVNEEHIFFSGSTGKFGYLNTADNSIAYIGTLADQNKTPDFRALARTTENDFIMSAGNPALIYKVNLFGKRKLLYKQTVSGTFFDALRFWNTDEGIAMGDPTQGCMAILITRDGGKTWTAVDCDQLKPAKSGEAAFAASNSNIAIVGDNTWILSGGTTTRVYYSPDKGKTWHVYNTPLVSGKPTTGGYAIDFYNSEIGIIAGGDYTNPDQNKATMALTVDGGKTWKLLAENQNPAYKSDVSFVPGTQGQGIVAIGITGISYSNDRGKTWVTLSDEPFYTIDFLNSFTAYVAGDGRIVQLTFLNQD